MVGTARALLRVSLLWLPVLRLSFLRPTGGDAADVHPGGTPAAQLLVLLPGFQDVLPVCQGMPLWLADCRPTLDGTAQWSDAVPASAMRMGY